MLPEPSDTPLVTPHIRRLLNYYDPLSPTYMQTPRCGAPTKAGQKCRYQMPCPHHPEAEQA